MFEEMGESCDAFLNFVASADPDNDVERCQAGAVKLDSDDVKTVVQLMFVDGVGKDLVLTQPGGGKDARQQEERDRADYGLSHTFIRSVVVGRLPIVEFRMLNAECRGKVSNHS